MKRFLLVLFALTVLASQDSFATNYELDEAAYEQLFEDATELEIQDYSCIQGQEENALGYVSDIARGDDLHALAAIAGIGELVLGLWFLPIHRIILGTSTGTIVGYVLTCGGCGLITLVDVILLLVNNDGRYVEVPRFIMW